MANGEQAPQGSVFDKALQASTPGFDTLLQVIQGETQRLERNYELIAEREQQEDMMKLKAQYDINLYEQTTAKDKKLDRQMQKDLAEMQLEAQQTEAEAKAGEDNLEKIQDLRKEEKERLDTIYDRRYRTIKDEKNLHFIPDVATKVRETNDGEIRGYFQDIDTGKRYTEEEFEQQYGWASRAGKYVDMYENLKEDLAQNEREEQMDINSLSENAIGLVPDQDALKTLLGESAVEQSQKEGEEISKRYLNREQAANTIAKLKNGDREVLKQFEAGIIDFNTRSEIDKQVIPDLKSNINNVQEILNTEAYIRPRGIFRPFRDFFSDRPTMEVSEMSASQIDEFVRNKYDEDSPELQHWQNLKIDYGKLDNARSSKPWSELYVNPFFGDDDSPADFFLTEEEIQEKQKRENVRKSNDIDLSQDFVRKKQSEGFALDAIINRGDSSVLQDSTNR